MPVPMLAKSGHVLTLEICELTRTDTEDWIFKSKLDALLQKVPS